MCRLKHFFNFLQSGFVPLLALGLWSCQQGSQGVSVATGVKGPYVVGTPETFRGAGIVDKEAFLFKGPLARGRQGDVLLQNDKIRVMVQKPARNAGVGTFGGNIIDADWVRPGSEAGQEQFGVMFPLINLAWTVNYQQLEIINADFSQGPVVLRATGLLDVYDYIPTTNIVPFAKLVAGVDLHYEDQFDDIFDPFTNIPLLRNFSPVVVTDYILSKDASHVTIETRLENKGDEPIPMPVGDWVNGSGSLVLFIPGKGFVRASQIDNTPALTYQALEEDGRVSYGYFYNPIPFMKADGSLPGAAGLSISGVTPLLLGENALLDVFPLSGNEAKINFTAKPGTYTVTRYFVVGTGDIASVMDEGLKALGVSRVRLSGMVKDQAGNPIERARVVFLDGQKPVTVAFSDAQGQFAADLSAGIDAKDKMFGSGLYTVEVYKEGYVEKNSSRAGHCNGGSFDETTGEVKGIQCTLGQTGFLNLSVDVDGALGPARVTIVGFDPSPTHKAGKPEDFGKFHDLDNDERPYGIVDVFDIDPFGKVYPPYALRSAGDQTVRLEPGEYEVFFTRGMEYSVDSQRIQITAGHTTAVQGHLHKVVDTAGYVSGDFHIHSINSPDSPFRMEERIWSAMAEGLDVLSANDHDYLTDYAPLVRSMGYENWLTSVVGAEITPQSYGHMIAWPLQVDTSRFDNGMYDHTYVPTDDLVDPGHDLIQSMGQISQGVQQTPGTQVISIAHITDKVLGNFSLSRLVTTKSFDGVKPFSTYADPVRYRLPPNTNAAGDYSPPFPLGTSEMFTLDFTSVGLTIGGFKDILEHLVETALPTYFNLLNLGKICSATADSDSHTRLREPIGIPRNYVASSVDPHDGVGTFPEIDLEELAVNVNAGRVIVSNGIFIRAKLRSDANPQGVTVGETLSGAQNVTLDLEVVSNAYFDWDSVEIYANTEPVPANDDLSDVTDLDAEHFHEPTKAHLPKYLMTPVASYRRGGGGDEILTQTVQNGVRRAVISKNFQFDEDTWVVILARGSHDVRSTFPYVTKEANPEVAQNDFLDVLDADPAQIKGIQAFAFTNPLFVDVDGNGFESKYIRDGTSPLAH